MVHLSGSWVNRKINNCELLIIYIASAYQNLDHINNPDNEARHLPLGRKPQHVFRIFLFNST